MSISPDSAAVFGYHRYMIALHGNRGPAALGWRDTESQIIRFDALAHMADLNGHSLLDAGCGHGDLRSYLHELYPDIVYYGLEQIPELFDEASRRFQDWEATAFIRGDFMTDEMPVADYVMASGSLNYYNADPDFIFKAITRLYEHCRRGLGFNLLSHIIPNGLLAAYNPDVIMQHCRQLSKQVVLKNDYSTEDFTVFMYR
ncbi:class I SAM-dependent methyltransferase [Mucilaginibacter sp. HC2]|uniref:methyltransferase n=1 Tax=Mucilaginibacter inviolabilis TaxID=2714892 RepID=UPI001407BBF3|nr:class I SAM-dependent methyltransferase [Mucilaginibacter inviolabilis]NHA02176.1 class I SAM-dependent methyltransferase [Mucilaginibacter inviolabilis]